MKSKIFFALILMATVEITQSYAYVKETFWACNQCSGASCIGVCRLRPEAGTGYNCVNDNGEKDCSGDRLVVVE